jgi:hypothetical protein
MRVSDVVKRCRAEVRLLREALGRAQINPVLLGAMRGSYQAERRSMQEWRTQLASARKQEQLARDALASVRNRERSVERALEFERRKQRAKQDVAQAALIDDLWLQQAWRRRR